MTLFYLTYGKKVMIPSKEDAKGITMVKKVKEIIEELLKIRNQAKKNIIKSQEMQKKQYDKIGR